MNSSLKKGFLVVVVFLIGMVLGVLVSRAEAQAIQTYDPQQRADVLCNWPTDPGFRGTQYGALLKSAGKECHETREHHVAALQKHLRELETIYSGVRGTHATYRSDEYGWQVMQAQMAHRISELRAAIADARTSTWASTPAEAQAAADAAAQKAAADAEFQRKVAAANRIGEVITQCRRDYANCDKEEVDRRVAELDALDPSRAQRNRELVEESYAEIEAGIERSNARAEERRQRQACETAKENLSGLPVVGMIVSRTKKC